MCIQGVLLGWLFIADILNNPFGYNLDYDTDLTEVRSQHYFLM